MTPDKIQLQEAPIEKKHQFTAWRVDYYICTAIAYAKSMGQNAEDFAKFVGQRHSIGNPDSATLETVAKSGHFVMTSYPGGKYEIISKSDSVLVAKSNRPYKAYFENGPIFGVTLDEFEKYFWEHVAVMHSKLNMNFKYEINGDEVLQTVTYKKS